MPGRRILVGKCGIDKHDRGAIIVSRALKDAGFEVVYVPSGHTPSEIAAIAADEDVDAVGISLHSGAHKAIFDELIPLLRQDATKPVVVFAGGTIPAADIPYLVSIGVDEVFTAGTPIIEIVDRVRGSLGIEATGQAVS